MEQVARHLNLPFILSFLKVCVCVCVYTYIYLFWLHQVLVETCRIFDAACELLVVACGSSSLARDHTQAPCIGSTEPSHWTTREVPPMSVNRFWASWGQVLNLYCTASQFSASWNKESNEWIIGFVMAEFSGQVTIRISGVDIKEKRSSHRAWQQQFPGG